jgi:bifunctional pyridoxal-dependent enzyme with beta-cystathionase and maltose regulon repressor activities
VGLDEAKIAAYVFRIAEAVNESVLKKVYAEAYGYAKFDQAASKAIIAAKDKRKSELQIEMQGQA